MLGMEDFDPLSDKKLHPILDENGAKMLSSGSLSNLTLEAISPGKPDMHTSSGHKSNKIIKPPKPKPPTRNTVTKTSLIPARSYDETKKKSQNYQEIGAKDHKTLEDKPQIPKFGKEKDMMSLDNMFKKSSDCVLESGSDTKQSIYISEMNGRVKAMENAVNNDSITPFGFSMPKEDEIVIEELSSQNTSSISAITHKDSQIEENKKLKPTKDLIDITFAKKKNFVELESNGITESKILQINEISQTFGPVDESPRLSTKKSEATELGNISDSMWLDSKRILDNTPLMNFNSCVKKLEDELIEPNFEILKIKHFLKGRKRLEVSKNGRYLFIGGE